MPAWQEPVLVEAKKPEPARPRLEDAMVFVNEEGATSDDLELDARQKLLAGGTGLIMGLLGILAMLLDK